MKRNIDVLVVGGGPAGLQAAMMLVRMRRRVLLCDDGRARNAPAQAMHYFPTRDGMAPADFREVSLAQLDAYPTFSYLPLRVEEVVAQGADFRYRLSGGEAGTARKMILATGVVDELPAIPGIQELYGRSVFHCPYCHGYEFRDRALGILAQGEMGFLFAGMLESLSKDVVVFTQGESGFSREQSQRLADRGMRVLTSPIVGLEASGDRLLAVRLADGQRVAREGLLLKPLQKPKSPIAEALGCKRLDDGRFSVDGESRSSVRGVFLAGDLTEVRQSALSSSYVGMVAGASVNHELVREDWGML